MSRHAEQQPAPIAGAGFCRTCAIDYRIYDSPVVDGLCAWGHVDPFAWLEPLTKLECAQLLEAITVAGELADEAADAAEAKLTEVDMAAEDADDDEAVRRCADAYALLAEFAWLRVDVRAVFERKFFEVTR